MELELADEALEDATYLLDGGRLRAAANRAYYAMFHAATTALDSEGVPRARTHMGAMHLFRENFIRTGRIPEDFSRNLQTAYNLRQSSDYEGGTSVDEAQVIEMVQAASDFIEEVKKLIAPQNSD